jgi:hypothetical protein
LGLLLVAGSVLVSLPQHQLLMIILFYSSLQLLQYVLDRSWYRSNRSKELKVKNNRIRSTNLHARRLKDFVPALLFSIAIVSYFISTIISVYLLSHDMLMSKMVKTSLLLLLNTTMFAYYFWQVYQVVYAKPKDFQLDYSKRLIQIKNKVKNMLFALTIYNIFILVLLIFKISQMGIASVIILTSLFFQAALFPQNKVVNTMVD